MIHVHFGQNIVRYSLSYLRRFKLSLMNFKITIKHVYLDMFLNKNDFFP